MNLNVFSLTPLLAAGISAALGIVVFRSTANRHLAGVFLLVSLFLTSWNLHFVALYSISHADSALAVASKFRWGSILLQPTILFLVLSLREQLPWVWRAILAADYILSLTLCIADWNGLVVASLRHFPWGYYSVGGSWYSIFSLSVLGNVCLALIALLTHYRASTEATIRHQLRFWLLGVAVALPLGTTNLLPAYGVSFYPLGNLGNVFWAATITYAVARHRLLDAGLVATQSAATVLVLAVLLTPFTVAMFWFQMRDFGATSSELTLSAALLTGVAAVAFPYLRGRLTDSFVRTLFPGKLAAREALLALSKTAAGILDRDRLLREVTIGLERAFEAESVVVAIRERSGNDFDIEVATGRVSGGARTIPAAHGIGAAFEQRRSTLTLAEARGLIANTQSSSVSEQMMRSGWEVCVPILRSGPPFGILALGRRAKYQPYTSQDLELLESLAAEIALALDNARLHEQLQISRDLIHRADRSSALGVLAAGMAHEIRNPLVSIRTFLQLVSERRNDEEFMTTFLKTASSEVERISTLISELLSFARSPNPTFVEVDLNDLVNSAVVLVSPEAKRARVSMELRPGSLTSPIRGSFEQLRQVVVNLLFNAVQACSCGDTIKVGTRIIQIEGDHMGEIEISDTGCGIPHEDIEKLFNPFFTTKSTGTGLGLSIVQQIINEHGGKVMVTSVPGSSTTFLVQVPVSRSPEHVSAS